MVAPLPPPCEALLTQCRHVSPHSGGALRLCGCRQGRAHNMLTAEMLCCCAGSPQQRVCGKLSPMWPVQGRALHMVNRQPQEGHAVPQWLWVPVRVLLPRGTGPRVRVKLPTPLAPSLEASRGHTPEACENGSSRSNSRRRKRRPGLTMVHPYGQCCSGFGFACTGCGLCSQGGVQPRWGKVVNCPACRLSSMLT